MNPMVERTARLDEVFRALAHPVRRAMLERLSRQPHCIGELSAPLAMTFAGASKHVRVLERARLVRRRIVGREHVCEIVPSSLREASDWLAGRERLWSSRLDALERYLAESRPARERACRTRSR